MKPTELNPAEQSGPQGPGRTEYRKNLGRSIVIAEVSGSQTRLERLGSRGINLEKLQVTPIKRPDRHSQREHNVNRRPDQQRYRDWLEPDERIAAAKIALRLE
jgi:hypothetical protein